MSDYGEYQELRELLEQVGGTMDFYPGGGPGGVWRIELRGKVAEVESRDRTVNDLDTTYVAAVDDPKTWDDFPESARLHDDAFWRLIEVIQRNEVPRE